MYGQPYRGLMLPNLSRHVNIVYGPNASGKTSLARAIQSLLLRDYLRKAHPHISGIFNIDDDEMEIEVAGKRRRYQLNGKETTWRPNLIRPQSYHIALHDLLSAETGDKSFAKEILRQASGGYDLSAAAKSLAFDKIPTFYLANSTKDVERKRTKLRKVRSDHEQLSRDRSRLNQLNAELQVATQAQQQVELLKQIQAYQGARTSWEAARAVVQQFDPTLRAATHLDLDSLPQQVDNLAAEITQLDSALTQCQRKLSKNEARIAANILPSEGLPEGFLEQLASQIQTLKNAESDVAKHQEKLAGLRKEAASLWASISDRAEDAERMNFADVTRITIAMRRKDEVHAKQRVFRDLEQILKIDAVWDPQERATALLEGLRHFMGWLRHGAPKLFHVKVTLWIAVLLILIPVLITGAWLGLAALVPVGLALIWLHALRIGSRKRTEHQRKFQKLGLSVPESWTEEEVEAGIDALAEEHAEAKLAQQKRDHWTARAADRMEIEAMQADLDKEMEALRQATGLNVEHPEPLYYLVTQILQYRQKASEAAGIDAALRAAKARRARCLGRINDSLAPYRLGPISQSDEAVAFKERLGVTHQQLVQMIQERKATIQLIDKDTQLRSQTLDRQQNLFTRIGIKDSAALHERIREIRNFLHENQKEEKARTVMEEREAPLHTTKFAFDTLKNQTSEEIATALDTQRHLADRREGIQKQITTIQTRIEDAERNNTLEIALATYNQSRTALEEEREADVAQIVGNVLFKTLKSYTRERELPEVFKKARDNFLTVTDSRYELRLGDEGTFRAWDADRDRTYNLEELSSATRVQLMLCVRVAFVESQEKDYRFPITLDEVLGNSDDVRAPAVIQTIVHLAAQRQVIYFTAQQDEVSKWKAFESSVPIRVLSLGQSLL